RLGGRMTVRPCRHGPKTFVIMIPKITYVTDRPSGSLPMSTDRRGWKPPQKASAGRDCESAKPVLEARDAVAGEHDPPDRRSGRAVAGHHAGRDGTGDG